MLFLLLTFFAISFSIILFIIWINNFYSKKIDKNNLELFLIIEKYQYNSPLFFAIRITEQNDFQFNDMRVWIEKYLYLMGMNFQKIIFEYSYVNSEIKFSFVRAILLFRLYWKLKKLKSKIQELNAEIKNKINIKDIEDNYKINLLKKLEILEAKLNDIFVIYPVFENNEKIKTLVTDININIKLVDEKIDDGRFFESAKLLFHISKLVMNLFNIINIYPQVLDEIYRNIEKKIYLIKETQLYKKNDWRFEEYNKIILEFDNRCSEEILSIKLDLNELNYNDALNKFNKLSEYVHLFYNEIQAINEIKFNYISDTELIWININSLAKNLENLIISSKLYLGDIELLNDNERLILKKAHRIFEQWNIEINKFIQLRDKALSWDEYYNLLNVLNLLIQNSTANTQYISEVNKIYNLHKKDVDQIHEKIFRLKNILNNLLRWLKNYSNQQFKNDFYNDIDILFKELDNIKMNNVYPSHTNRIKMINQNIADIEEKISDLEINIKQIILFDKLTEELIVYNNRYLITYPEFGDVLRDSKKAYNENDIDLSFRLSLSILNNIKEKVISTEGNI